MFLPTPFPPIFSPITGAATSNAFSDNFLINARLCPFQMSYSPIFFFDTQCCYFHHILCRFRHQNLELLFLVHYLTISSLTPAAVLSDVLSAIPLWLSSIIDLLRFFADIHSYGHANSLQCVHWCTPFSHSRLQGCLPNPFMIIDYGSFTYPFTTLYYGVVYLTLLWLHIIGIQKWILLLSPYLLLIYNPPWAPPNGPELKELYFNLHNIVIPITGIQTKSSILHTLTH